MLEYKLIWEGLTIYIYCVFPANSVVIEYYFFIELFFSFFTENQMKLKQILEKYL